MVRPKKTLGQHFLTNDSIAQRIAESVDMNGVPVLEIGPGKGKLTQFLLKRFPDLLKVIEVDDESVEYLAANFPDLHERVIAGDFLKTDFSTHFANRFDVVGNFPYNISSQILFKMLEHRDEIHQLVGMFQKEVADRVVAAPGSKTYGILSVLVQAFYKVEYLFTVQPGSFFPPPKVKSGVIRLKRNNRERLNCDEKVYFKVVKLAFNQRRKTLRNSLKSVINPEISGKEIFNMRPEQLRPEDFEHICNLLE
ncbi:16S rRNA (adenine(1518)-N(6)/adenine(1519)-N(6))-dimethyltransferase RsmA [Salinivirga cyanobacteriivorans]|uniref:Ribosomal RNA small subunit methyltransferase A n=1 Tax=Salinivirga cyanobacteriivorans TaxID=1307839 RepID=A0A0S2HXG1_9BACT|nr:16S rRNA (adenine(1518)-N(6)/adenine(1519)-N(6))-dimethyltransferase RsmA [Salinivirga cyanobacteriivorans]ALO14726.1 Ribosomal RNA small subunit methyltransferase A [Salinivirga cyanobacteriivorans]